MRSAQVGKKVVGQYGYEGRDPMYIGVGTILLIILIILLIAFVF
jgi:hypothetical protein